MTHSNRVGPFVLLGTILSIALSNGARPAGVQGNQRAGGPATLTARLDERAGTIAVFRAGSTQPVVTQHARADERPYIHPIVAPDGRGVLTELSPSHHPHQTGVFWGFTSLNGRDYFHNRGGDHWRRVAVRVSQAAGEEVSWQTVYDLLDEKGRPVLTETQRWSMTERDGRFLLQLQWQGEAKTDVTIAKHDYGGLFLRMPWRAETGGEVVNAARQRNERAEGQRALWVDVGVPIEGRRDRGHIAVFDHPDNAGYPQPWRVDGQLGVGPARGRAGDWSIKRGETEIIRHGLLAYTGEMSDVELMAAWTEYGGSRGMYASSAQWWVAQREGREARFLSPDEAVAAMTVKDGYRVQAWAAEPMLTQPMAFCWDDRGRLWVAENRDYENRVEGFSNAGDSRILILEDTDRDGKADSRKVFLEGIPFPAALAVGFDGVFVGAPPNLLFVPDRNRDDKADMEAIEVRLTGWGILDRHETLNSLHWGPDGWLYGLQGYATPSKVRKPAGKGRIYKAKEPFPEDLLEGEGVEINGGVWRYHPTKDVFEVVAHGFSNPWGIDYDAKGQLLISACVIPHLWHVIPGGIYHRQGGQHFNPYVYSDIQTIADHRHRSAHGGARVYQSDAFPASQRGRLFMANIHEHAVLSDVLERKGSGFTARHGDDFLLANNAQWIGFSVEIGPDGALYVLDWHDGDICGQDILHQETGRIFRIAPETSLAKDWPGRYSDVRAMSDAQLVELQTSASDWHARRARVVLQHRAAERKLSAGTHEGLRRLFADRSHPDWRLRAMWALHVTGGWTPDALATALGDPDEYVRAWAVQLLSEDRAPSAGALKTFAAMARTDASPVVRLYLASALQRIDRGGRWAIAEGLMARGEDAEDHNLPKMLWLAIEPLVAADPALALRFAGESRIPLVARFVARRAVDADAAAAVVEAIGRAPQAQVSLLEGLREGLEGRVDVAPPDGWARLYERLQRADARTAEVARGIAGQFADTESARRNLAAVRDRTAPPDERRKALRILTLQRRPQLADELPAALDDPEVRLDAIRAIAAFDDEELGRALMERLPTLTGAERSEAVQTLASRRRYGRMLTHALATGAERSEAVQTLASRRRYGRMLTDALATGAFPKSDVPPHVARQLRRVVGTAFAEVWGSVEQNTHEERAFARYRGLLNETALSRADAHAGRNVFATTCGSCHKMFGEGGTIGPDLTGANRTSLDYLLFNVLTPNAEVAEAYRMVVVTTRDGRTLSGRVVAENDRQLTLSLVGQDPIAIAKSDIQSREVTPVSLMPPGLFDALTDREVLDLVAYLRTVDPPVAKRD